MNCAEPAQGVWLTIFKEYVSHFGGLFWEWSGQGRALYVKLTPSETKKTRDEKNQRRVRRRRMAAAGPRRAQHCLLRLHRRPAARQGPLSLQAGAHKNVTSALPRWKALLSPLPTAPFQRVRGAGPGGCCLASPHGWTLMRCVRLLAASFQSLSYYFKAAAPRFRQVWSLGKISQLGFKREDALFYYLSL